MILRYGAAPGNNTDPVLIPLSGVTSGALLRYSPSRGAATLPGPSGGCGEDNQAHAPPIRLTIGLCSIKLRCFAKTVSFNFVQVRLISGVPEFVFNFRQLFAASPLTKFSGFVVLFFAYFDFFSDIQRVQYLVGKKNCYTEQVVRAQNVKSLSKQMGLG